MSKLTELVDLTAKGEINTKLLNLSDSLFSDIDATFLEGGKKQLKIEAVYYEDTIRALFFLNGVHKKHSREHLLSNIKPMMEALDNDLGCIEDEKGGQPGKKDLEQEYNKLLKLKMVLGYLEGHLQPARISTSEKIRTKTPPSLKKSTKLKKSKKSLEYVDSVDSLDSEVMPIVTALYKRGWGLPARREAAKLPTELPTPSFTFVNFFANLWRRTLSTFSYTANRNQPTPPPALTGNQNKLATHIVEVNYFPPGEKKSTPTKTPAVSNEKTKTTATPGPVSRMTQSFWRVFSRKESSNPKSMNTKIAKITLTPPTKNNIKATDFAQKQKPNPPPGIRPKTILTSGGNLGGMIRVVHENKMIKQPPITPVKELYTEQKLIK